MYVYKSFPCRIYSVFIALSPEVRDEREKYRAVYMKSRLHGFKSKLLCCSFPRAAGWQNCSAVSQVCGFVPFSAVPVWAVLTVFRYVTAPWGPLADAARKKILRPFQPSPGYWTGLKKHQEEDLQVSSENSVSPQLQFFWQPMIVLRLAVSWDYWLCIGLPMCNSTRVCILLL